MELAETLFVVDSMPLPACKRVHSKRCHKVQGRDFYGYCAAKERLVFGWKLHLICDIQGRPITFDILPVAYHDPCPCNSLLADLPTQAWVLADKGYTSDVHAQAACGLNHIRLIAKRRRNISPNDPLDAALFALFFTNLF